MPETQDIPKLSVPALREQIERGNADPAVIDFNVQRYRVLLATATAQRDEQSIDILSKAVEEFSVLLPEFQVLRISEPNKLDSPDQPQAGPPLSAPMQKVMTVLGAAGYLSLDAIRQASDDELLAIKGIGFGRLIQIREAFPKDK